MLIRRATLEAIRDGRVRLQFRRWKRPTVKAGGTLATAIGQLAIDAVDTIDLRAIGDEDARRAGFETADAVRSTLGDGTGTVYRISLRYAGPDPRVALRERAELAPEELAEIRGRLRRLDAAARDGAWTLAALRAIDQAPGRLARDLASDLDRDTAAFKRDVGKLKALGLTESLKVGYRLSPRGEVVLRELTAGDASELHD